MSELHRLLQGIRVWVVIPAAGIGTRMQSALPKQYLPLLDETLLEVTLKRFLGLSYIEGVMLPLHSNDTWWSETSLSDHPKIHTTCGGDERSDSVLNGLAAIREWIQESDSNVWVMVHDAARPCVTEQKIEELLVSCLSQSVGGILAVPASDTVKKVPKASDNAHLIQGTEDRSTLWLAHTPQLFPLDQLFNGLTQCAVQGLLVTDESSAIENVGGKSIVVNDRTDNIKVTVPEDLQWAELILKKLMEK